MISVRSLLQQLNGNNLGLFLLVFLFFSSCGLLQPIDKQRDKDKEEKEEELDPIGGGRIYNPETGEFEETPEVLVDKMDTIRWKEISTREYPPITTEGVLADNSGDGRDVILGEGEFGTQLLRSYNISMMLPFLTDRFDGSDPNLDPNARWAVQFYTGAKLAMEKLSAEGVNLKVSAYDTRANALALNEILQRDTGFIQSSHLIMGTVRGECVKRMADYAGQQRIPFVSPFSASSGITRGNPNPFYLQINPSLTTHLKELTRHAKENYNSDQIVLVAPGNNERAKDRLRYLQLVNAELAGSTYVPRLEELIIDDETPTLEETNIDIVMKNGRETVFIVPMWEDKAFIYAFLRKAYLASRYTPVVVYGMPQWQRFEDADYNYYENLNVHISSEYYTDNYDEAVREFRQSYYDEFSTIPSAEAFRGYDNMLYFGRMLKKHGTRFYEFFDREVRNSLHTTYSLQPILTVQKDSYGRETTGDPERFENQFVHILKFEDFYFQPAE
ncbi:MAG: ABC transporter substrate-binding protein [Bacteroidota bacterium]